MGGSEREGLGNKVFHLPIEANQGGEGGTREACCRETTNGGLLRYIM